MLLLWFLILFAGTQAYSVNNETVRESRFWDLGSVVRFRNDPCTSNEGLEGICYTRSECTYGNGIGSGSCANRFGQCCVFQITCGNTSIHNNTYFVNPGFPSTFNGQQSCTITIKKCNPDICQVRLDFLDLNLAQPDGTGFCVTDSLVITGSASNVPVICGINNGQQMYLNFNGNSSILLTINTGLSTFQRSWNIKITQLACDCPGLAPTGCLQYYTALSDTVTSFNYGTALNGNNVNTMPGTPPTPQTLRPGTRQLANENYGVCVQMQAGYCAIQWSQGPDSTSFTVSGDTVGDAVIPGLPSNGQMGTACTADFVVIPVPSLASNAFPLSGDRFCGNQLPTVISKSKPFVMTVVTNGDEIGDIGNRGFSLNYQQIPCGATPGVLMMLP